MKISLEIIVRDGRWFTVGDSGAGFYQYKKGDIIFNHKQSEELLKNGKVTSGGGRAKAFAQGTAFAEGEYGGSAVGTNKGTFDWIEILLSRLERTINNFVKAADDTSKSWTDRTNANVRAIVENEGLIRQLGTVKTTYQNEANSVNLSEDIKALVRNGAFIASDKSLTEEEVKKANEYKELWEKYLDAQDKYTEAVRTQTELQIKHFDYIVSAYDGILEGFGHTESMLDEYISQTEARGHIVSANYYDALIQNKNSEKDELVNKRRGMIDERDRLVREGHIDINSEEYRKMSNEIDNVTLEIEKATTQTIGWQNAIRDLEFEQFELAHEYMSRLTSESEFLIELMSNKKLHNDDGTRTAEGDATLGLLAENYHQSMYEADDYGVKAADIARRMTLDPSEEGYLDPLDQNNIDKYNEYIELQRESILNAEDQKQAIKDLISEGYDKELDALQEKIDKTNEALDSQKDLYDYQKNVQKQSEEIAALEKQRAAYLSDTSESGRAKLQEITVSLKEAKESLAETEFDRYISQQEELLSSLYEEYELTLNTRLDDLDGLVEDVFTAVEENAVEIGETLFGKDGTGGVAGSVGVAVSDELKSIWTEGGVGNKLAGSVETIETILGDIKKKVVGEDGMAGKSDEEAEENINKPTTTTSAASNHSSGSGGGSNGNGGSNGGNKSTGDGNAKIGDKVTFLSGKYYYDSQGVNPAGSKYQGKQVYITNVNKKSWATHPYHISTGRKLGQGDLGWLKLNQLSGYATGKKNFLNDEIAWTQENGRELIVRPSDGAILTPVAKGDSVLTSAASNNIWDMANSPAEFIKDNLNLGAANVPNGSNTQNNITQNLDKVVFNLPNVRNYEQLLAEMQKDKNFERLILSMTIDKIAGKSSLAKNKSIR